jgi:hypothetical protein
MPPLGEQRASQQTADDKRPTLEVESRRRTVDRPQKVRPAMADAQLV